ncbi:MAG TPA: VWA domain-containing protein, partial [Sumerlaeia bacterium]|nr:VWA domain-containing protein [Sumerlaeia bacterium]
MQIQFGQPYVLLLAIPFVAHAIWMARRLRLLSRTRRCFALALRLLVLLALICALARMRVSFESKDLTVLFVVDDSDSVPETQKEFAKVFVQKAHEEMGAEDRQWIVLFGADAAIEQTPLAPPEFEAPQAVVDGARTNLADAIQLAIACASGKAQKRIVLLSDGNQNAGGVENAARSAAAAGITVDVLPLKYENRNDVIVEKAIVEDRVSLDEPFDIRIIATSSEVARGTLSVHQDGRLIGQYDVDLNPGQKNSFVIPTEVRDAGYHRFEVQLDADNDAIPENNRAFAFTYGTGGPRVLLVDGDQERSLTLPAALQSEKINVEIADPSGLPHSLRTLQMYDAIVFNNVAAGDVTPQQMQMLEYGVRDLGLGFMMIGGENSFGAGGYNDSPVERILPVEMELKNEKILPQGALVPIVHTVEIPEGQYWAEQILHSALDVLSPRDLMGVLQYSWQSGESWLFPLQEVGRKNHLRKKLLEAQWGDMPSFDTTLQMAYDALVKSSASVKHIIVISDGDPQTPNQNLVRKIRAAKITISTVCINPHSPRDAQVMQALARLGGGNFYEPQSYDKLPQIFIKEAATVRKSLVFEEPFIPVTKQYSPVLVGFDEIYP